MLSYMLDANICIHVMKTCPPEVRETFNASAEQLCISSITLRELHYGAEKSARRVDNLAAIEYFVARSEVLPFGSKAAAHYGQVRAERERAGMPCGPHDIRIGAHARSEGPYTAENETPDPGTSSPASSPPRAVTMNCRPCRPPPDLLWG